MAISVTYMGSATSATINPIYLTYSQGLSGSIGDWWVVAMAADAVPTAGSNGYAYLYDSSYTYDTLRVYSQRVSIANSGNVELVLFYMKVPRNIGSTSDRLYINTTSTDYNSALFFKVSGIGTSESTSVETSPSYGQAVYNNYRAGNLFCNVNPGTLTSIDIMLAKYGNPTGTVTITARSGNISDDGGILATLGTIDISTLTTTPTWYTFNSDSCELTGEPIFIAAGYSGGDASNYLVVPFADIESDDIYARYVYQSGSPTDLFAYVNPFKNATGLTVSRPFDKSSTATGTDAPYNTGSTGTLSQADEVGFAFIGVEEELDQIDAAFTSGTGYISTGKQTAENTLAGGGAKAITIAGAYQIVTTTDSLQGNLNDGAPDWAALVVTFKESPQVVTITLDSGTISVSGKTTTVVIANNVEIQLNSSTLSVTPQIIPNTPVPIIPLSFASIESTAVSASLYLPNIGTLDYSFLAEPFFLQTTQSASTLKTLDYVFLAEPFFGIKESGTGDITVSLDFASIILTGNDITLIKGEKSTVLSTASLSATAQIITLSLATLLTLDTASLTLTPQILTVLKGTVAISFDYGTVSITPQALTLAKGEVIIGLDTATITVTAQNITVAVGERTIVLDAALITIAGQILEADSGIPPPTAVELFVAQLTFSAQSFTLVEGAISVTLNNSSVSANGQALSILKGEITVQLNNGSISVIGQVVSIDEGENLLYFDSATITSLANTITLYSTVSIILDSALLTITPQSSQTVSTYTSSLSASNLSITGQTLSVVEGEVSISLAVASVSIVEQTISVLKGEITTLLDTASTTITPQTIDVVTSASILLVNASLTLNGQTISLSVGEYILILDSGSISLAGQAITVKNLALIVPEEDISLGEWTDELDGTTDIYTSIDEELPNDSDYIKSPFLPQANTYKVKLQNAVDPETGNNHSVFCRFSCSGSASIKIRLVEGTTTIAEWEEEASASIVTVEKVLTTEQADSITDYENLYLELEAV